MTVTIVGVIPAAGHALRLQPLMGSKEMLAVRGKPVVDYLVERMRAGGCTTLRIVTRPEKSDLITHAEEIGAEIVLARPATVSESFLAGMVGLTSGAIALIGFPDTIWEPVDGYRPLVAAVQDGADVGLGLFRIAVSDLARSDVVVFGESGCIEGVDVKPAKPQSEWIWGCAAARVETWAGLHRAEWPGGYIDLLCREGHDVRGFELSDSWLDIGTKAALRRITAYADLSSSWPSVPPRSP
ncbi:MAG: NTP transferase domain-containing protein [Actinomycetota bacterium]|nr:NTP transferase domain-containing protein [Actinomycetota bacterium]